LATADVEVNGEWEQWYERKVDLAATTGGTETSGCHDLFILFTHPNKSGGLMNLDSIYFAASKSESPLP